MQLYIGNKNYSSWSLRPWLLMRETGIAFEEIKLRLDFDEASPFKQTLRRIAPTGRVPVLVDAGFAVWDTLAIAEYLAEKYPDKLLWPRERQARARARSICAEMHSGFSALRQHCPMIMEASLPEIGQGLMASRPDVVRDLARITEMWELELAAQGGPFLFGEFGIADAYFAPVCARIRTYALPISPRLAEYVDRIHALPALQEWVADAVAEHDFLPEDEPYRTAA